MGCDFYAYIQMYDSPDSLNTSTWDLTGDSVLVCKDYDFYAAIAGVRNQSGKRPLVSPRRLPPGSELSNITRLKNGYVGVGWLTVSEIKACMDHMGLRLEDRREQIQRLLEVLEVLERRAGKDRVRLVFGFVD